MSDLLILSSEKFFDKTTYLEYLRVFELSIKLRYGLPVVGSCREGVKTGLDFTRCLGEIEVARCAGFIEGRGRLAGEGQQAHVSAGATSGGIGREPGSADGGIEPVDNACDSQAEQGHERGRAVDEQKYRLHRDVGGVEFGTDDVRGVHWKKNRAKRDRAKALRDSVRELKDVCPSLSGSVQTVDTRTAEEIEAVRTLAARRVVENKVAMKMAELRLVSLNNKDKTSAVLRLEAARMEQRINDAKARSQASFKKCDQSLKSLGSTGSAGEYALKQEVKKGKDAEVKLEYSQRQLRMFYEHATPDVRQMVADIPEPTFESYIDVFGDCPSEFDEEEAQAYYDDLSLRTAEAGLI